MGEATATLERRARVAVGVALGERESTGVTTPGGLLGLDGILGRKPAPRRREERWCSSLCQDDLARLLSVIEAQVIPRLVAGYSPARASPLD